MGTGNVCVTDQICLNAAGFPFVIYGILLVVFIIFLPKGIVGGIHDWWLSRKSDDTETVEEPAPASAKS